MQLRGIGARLYRGETRVDFLRLNRVWFALSAALVAISVGAVLLLGLNLGIEFTGGAQFRAPTAAADAQGADVVAEVRDAVEEVGVGEPLVQTIGADVRVTTPELDEGQVAEVAAAIADVTGADLADEVAISTVGAAWGETITVKALQGLAIFLVLVVIYLGFRFELRMAVGAVVALLHDLALTAGIYALLGFEVTPATVIGLLTILGYSLYDTVVVFDKVQENVRGLLASSRQTYAEAANLALNQVLARSLNTSVIALLPVAGLLFVGAGLLGASTLVDLSLALFVGIAVGTYSSIFLATPVLVELKQRDPAHVDQARRVAARRAGKDVRGVQAPAGDRVAAARRRRAAAAGGAAGDTTTADDASSDGGTTTAAPPASSSGGPAWTRDSRPQPRRRRSGGSREDRR